MRHRYRSHKVVGAHLLIRGGRERILEVPRSARNRVALDPAFDQEAGPDAAVEIRSPLYQGAWRYGFPNDCASMLSNGSTP